MSFFPILEIWNSKLIMALILWQHLGSSLNSIALQKVSKTMGFYTWDLLHPCSQIPSKKPSKFTLSSEVPMFDHQVLDPWP